MQEPWYCKNCIKQILPFSELSDSQLCRVTKENLKSTPKKIIQDNNLVFLNDQYGTAIKNDSFTPDEFYKNLKTISPTYNLVIHMNISSLQYYSDDLRYLVKTCPNKPKIIGITECRLRTNREVLSNIDLNDYSFEFITTESTKRGSLIYIQNDLRYKILKDINLYREKEVESTFIEIIGCIYKHPNVAVSEFRCDFINTLLEKLSHEKKEIILMGDLNINFLNCDSDKDTSDFIDTMCASSLYPTINSPTRITPTSKTLFDNIFHNDFTKKISSEHFNFYF